MPPPTPPSWAWPREAPAPPATASAVAAARTTSAITLRIRSPPSPQGRFPPGRVRPGGSAREPPARPHRPGRRRVARRSEPRKAFLSLREADFRLVGAPELEQRAAEHDLRRPHLVEVVDAIGEELDRVTRILLRLLELPRVELDARERGHGLRGVGVVAEVARARELALPLREQRGLEGGVRLRHPVAGGLRELERALHVLARGGPVASAA